MSAGITVQGKDRKLAEARERRGEERCRRTGGWTMGRLLKCFSIHIPEEILQSPPSGKLVRVPRDLCRSRSGQPRGTGSQQQSSCPGTAWAGDCTGDSPGCFCSPKAFGEYGKKGQVFLRKAGGIYSQLRSVQSYYLPLWYAEPLVSPALVPQTKDDFENEGTAIKDTSK